MQKREKLFKFDTAEYALRWAYADYSMGDTKGLVVRFNSEDILNEFNGLIKRNRILPVDAYFTSMYAKGEYHPMPGGRNIEIITNTLVKLEKVLVRKKIVKAKSVKKKKEKSNG